MVAVAAPAAVKFFVPGKAVAKGSVIVRHQHGERMRHPVTGKPTCSCRNYAVAVADDKLEEWDALVATAAKRAMLQRSPFGAAVLVSMTFFYARPKSHTAAQREYRYVIAKGRNDSDKLSRAILDALTSAAVWWDDSQAMLGHVFKVYCAEDEVPGVAVTLEALL